MTVEKYIFRKMSGFDLALPRLSQPRVNESEKIGTRYLVDGVVRASSDLCVRLKVDEL
jgi:hypothetical protein